ncbi:hypothetical protein NUQ38_11540, partial [Glaesserella parasuis]|nr:hypothetical protein [Glaesserella parasuis]
PKLPLNLRRPRQMVIRSRGTKGEIKASANGDSNTLKLDETMKNKNDRIDSLGWKLKIAQGRGG